MKKYTDEQRKYILDNHPKDTTKKKPKKDADPERGRKVAMTLRRPIYLCPLPSTVFRVAPLVWLAEQAASRGFDPLRCDFFATLRLNRQYLVEYVVFGLFHGRDVVASAKDWPENVLTMLPSREQQVNLALEDSHRFEKVDRWVNEDTALKMVRAGVAKWSDTQPYLLYGDLKVGTHPHVPDDVHQSSPYSLTRAKPVVYPSGIDEAAKP